MAVKLGQDPVNRRAVREDLRRRALGMYQDTSPVRALEDFLEKLLRDRASDTNGR